MIPADYICSKCKAESVKLWRPYQTFRVELLCGKCTEEVSGHKIDLGLSDQCSWYVPAVPDLQGSYWGYTSVPLEGLAWWEALPLRLEGEWLVKGGKMKWIDYSLWMKTPELIHENRLKRISRDRNTVLVFYPR